MALLTDGQTVIDAEGAGAAALESLGWKPAESGTAPKVVDNITAAGALKIAELEVNTGKGIVDAHLVNKDGDPTPAEHDPADLKGADLDAALKAADLPVSGTADEKRQRLAEYVAVNPAE